MQEEEYFGAIVAAFLETLARGVCDAARLASEESHAAFCRRADELISYRLPDLAGAIDEVLSAREPSKPEPKLPLSAVSDIVPSAAELLSGVGPEVAPPVEAGASATEDIAPARRWRPAQFLPLSVKSALSAVMPVRKVYDAIFPPSPPPPPSPSPPPPPPLPVRLAGLTESELHRVSLIIAGNNLTEMRAGKSFAENIPGEREETFIFASHVFPTTWSPIVRALNVRGRRTIWCGADDHRRSIRGYSVLETGNVPVHRVLILPFFGMIAFLANCQRFATLLNGECFYAANWSIEGATVLYFFMSAFVAAIKSGSRAADNLTLFMYDGLKPVVQGDGSSGAITHFYQQLMSRPDRIIYNSNTEIFGEYIANALRLETPRLHFYRYSVAPMRPGTRLSLDLENDLHMVCITVSLGEFFEPSRSECTAYLRDVILQGVHFHYYCVVDDPAVLQFRQELPPERRDFFHTHPIDKDQSALVNEIAQYHVGFNPADHVSFAHAISLVKDRFYQDGLATYLQSTVGTSFLVYAAAGVPFLLPRACVGAQNFLGATAIPVLFSELKDIRRMLKRCDLPRRIRFAEENRSRAHAETHIDRFIEFLR